MCVNCENVWIMFESPIIIMTVLFGIIYHSVTLGSASYVGPYTLSSNCIPCKTETFVFPKSSFASMRDGVSGLRRPLNVTTVFVVLPSCKMT